MSGNRSKSARDPGPRAALGPWARVRALGPRPLGPGPALRAFGPGPLWPCIGHVWTYFLTVVLMSSDLGWTFFQQKSCAPVRGGLRRFFSTQKGSFFEHKSAKTLKTSENLRKSTEISKTRKICTRRHANNAGNLPGPCPIAPRDEISRSGEPLTPI